MLVEGSSISCGVGQLYGFEDESQRATVDYLIEVVSYAMWRESEEQRRWGGWKKPRLSMSVFAFSDRIKRNGDKFGLWLVERFPDTITRVEARNPNSGHRIATYLWRPDARALEHIDAWKRGRQRAMVDDAERRAAAW